MKGGRGWEGVIFEWLEVPKPFLPERRKVLIIGNDNRVVQSCTDFHMSNSLIFAFFIVDCYFTL